MRKEFWIFYASDEYLESQKRWANGSYPVDTRPHFQLSYADEGGNDEESQDDGPGRSYQIISNPGSFSGLVSGICRHLARQQRMDRYRLNLDQTAQAKLRPGHRKALEDILMLHNRKSQP